MHKKNQMLSLVKKAVSSWFERLRAWLRTIPTRANSTSDIVLLIVLFLFATVFISASLVGAWFLVVW